MSRVLVVDDDEAVREVLVQALEDADFEADAVESGRAALKTLCAASAEDRPYDAMVLDIIMPDLDGWDVLEAVKHNPLWSEMPVVVISGQSNGAGDVARVSSYDGFFVEKSGNFVDVVKTALGRLLRAA
jgi:CheY-like chemotaxis protein